MGGTWKKVNEFVGSNVLFGLLDGLGPWKQQVILWQRNGDNFAVGIPLAVLTAAAAQSDTLEINQLSSETREVVFVSATQSALEDLFLVLQNEGFSSWVLASPSPVSFGVIGFPVGLSAEPVDGTVQVKTREGKLVFCLSFVSKRQAKASPRFEPVKEPIGETSSNLRQRAEWFKRRSGR